MFNAETVISEAVRVGGEIIKVDEYKDYFHFLEMVNFRLIFCKKEAECPRICLIDLTEPKDSAASYVCGSHSFNTVAQLAETILTHRI